MLETHLVKVHGDTKNISLKELASEVFIAKAVQPGAHCSTILCTTIVTGGFREGTGKLILMIQV